MLLANGWSSKYSLVTFEHILLVIVFKKGVSDLRMKVHLDIGAYEVFNASGNISSS